MASAYLSAKQKHNEMRKKHKLNRKIKLGKIKEALDKSLPHSNITGWKLDENKNPVKINT